MFRIIFLVFSLMTFFSSLFLLAEHWEYEEVPGDIEAKFKQQVSLEEINTIIRRDVKAGNLDDARMVLELAKRFDYEIDEPYWRQKIAEKDTWQHRVGKGVEGFASGFASGKGDDAYALAGAMTSDFTVVGDVRDLHEQYENHETGKPVNELIVTLSGVGIGLTAVTVGSAGSSLPAKAGASILKFAGKTGRLTKSFSRELVQKTQKSFDWQTFAAMAKADTSLKGIKNAARTVYNPRAMRELTVMAEQANSIRKATSTVDTVHLLKYVENGDDLRRMERIANDYGRYTKSIMRFLGKSALRGAKVLKKTLGFIMSIISLVLSGFLSVLFMVPSVPKAKA